MASCMMPLSGSDYLLIFTFNRRMGTTNWDGVPLRSGCQMRFPGKLVELDNQVAESVVPRIIGALPFDGPIDDDLGDMEASVVNEDYSPVINNSFSASLIGEVDMEIVENPHITPSTRKKFVPPTTLLAKPEIQPSRKESKPLYAITTFPYSTTIQSSLAMIPVLKVRL